MTAAEDNACVGGEDEICRRMVASLSEEEKEHAARFSYRYFIDSISKSSADTSEETRERSAMKMARRHLIVEKGDENRAVEKMKACIQWRVEFGIDDIRRCFYEKDFPADEKLNKKYSDMRSGLEKTMEDGKYQIQGYDKKNRALSTLVMSKYTSFDDKYHTVFSFYMVERALAATERSTNGKEEKVIIFFDYSAYSLKNFIPLGLVKEFLSCLAAYYPGVMEHIYLVDTPLIFRAAWFLIKPFIDPFTKSKVKFLTGEEQKREEIAPLVSEDQATPFMLAAGGKVKPFDKDEFFKIPFDHIFDED